MGKYYRITYKSIGIYEALKQKIFSNYTEPEKLWNELKESVHFKWLNIPPNYSYNCISYFTEEGLKKFKENTNEIMLKYLEEENIKIDECKIDNEKILYEDNEQIVIKNNEYLILDFGYVLGYPTTGNWHMSPKFLELVDMSKINQEKLNENVKKYKKVIDCSAHVENIDEEYKLMVDFYYNILKDAYENNSYELCEKLAYNKIYESDKYKLYDDVEEQLERLSKKYKLLLISDSFPSLMTYMRETQIAQYFEKIYISSMYGTKKLEGTFFDEAFKEYNLKGNAIFVDDKEENLIIAYDKGIECILMDRKNKTKESKFKVIYSLKDMN